jgi:hypothetical protein
MSAPHSKICLSGSTNHNHPRHRRAIRTRSFSAFKNLPPHDNFARTYVGLMFFRPKFTGVGPMGSSLGLDGFGHFDVNKLTQPRPPNWVKVFIGFRPRASVLDVFATLQFLNRVLPDIPVGQTVEFNQVNALGSGIIEMDVPPSKDDGWVLGFRKTTVLFPVGSWLPRTHNGRTSGNTYSRHFGE